MSQAAEIPEALFQEWRRQRHEELAGPDSWFGVAGLFWLEEGGNAVGSGPDCPVRLPSGPVRLGVLRVEAGGVVWQGAAAGVVVEASVGAAGGGAIRLATDRAGPPSVLHWQALSWFVIERQGRLAVRVRNREWAAGRAVDEIPAYPYDAAWRVEASWQPVEPPLALEVPAATGELEVVTVSRRAVFALAGQELALLPMAVGPDGAFFVFRDRSSGGATYGAGRFLKVPAGEGDALTLDFNFAYNPPCALTPFATCPLPPPENWLPVAVAAGEKKPALAEH